MELVTWRGTPGVGDFMWALNSAHNHCFNKKCKVLLEMHWEHGPDHLHHFEDPETIIERMEYIHNFYHRKDDVTIKHVFAKQTRYSDWKYSDDLIAMPDGRTRVGVKSQKKNRFWFQSGTFSDKAGGNIPVADWVFRKDARKPMVRNKVVIWRPTFNAEVPRTWKRFLTHEEWDDIISLLRRAGLNVVELTYRTPISEAMYHISTCRQILCYDGMWHYIARNFMKPIIVISPEGITRYHTPHCVKASPFRDKERNIFDLINNIPDLLGESKLKALEYEKRCNKFYQDR